MKYCWIVFYVYKRGILEKRGHFTYYKNCIELSKSDIDTINKDVGEKIDGSDWAITGLHRIINDSDN